MSAAAADALIAGRYRVIAAGEIEEQGVDVEDGRPVLVRPAIAPSPVWSRFVPRFVEQEELETTARIAAALDTPWRLPVLCPSPRIVYAAPPPAARPEAPLALADAAVCLLQLCDVLARAHAAGFAGIGADIHDVRVHREGGAWRTTVVLPHLPPRSRRSHTELPPWRFSLVQRDMWTAVAFFRDLLLGREPPPGERRDFNPNPPLPPIGDGSTHAMLSQLLVEEKAVDGIPDVASLAERVLPLAGSPADWQSRVASMPRVPRVAVRRDFERLIVLGEDARRWEGRGPDDPYLIWPLAAAYHQRACGAYARGDFDAALRDVEQAISLDRWPRYVVTRGMVRAALGDPEGALADYDVAITLSMSSTQREEDHDGVRTRWELEGAEPIEGARAHYARGVTRYRRGDIPGACEDLQEAVSALSTRHWERWASSDPSTVRLSADPFELTVGRSLVVALRAAVRAAPEKPGLRWKLAQALRDLGREAEARAVADEILALDPGDERKRQRYARMFRTERDPSG